MGVGLHGRPQCLGTVVNIPGFPGKPPECPLGV